MGTPGASTLAKRVKLTKEDGEEREGDLVAIKKFKPDKDGEAVTFTGISQSACREIMVSFCYANLGIEIEGSWRVGADDAMLPPRSIVKSRTSMLPLCGR